MNRLLLIAPKTILSKYISKHFMELSVEDFFSVEKRIRIPSYYFSIYKNDTLRQSSSILSYMLDKDINVFRNFNEKAFSKECISKLAYRNVRIKEEDIEEYPILLENNKLCENLIRENPMLIKKLHTSQITPKIISLLADSYYVPDEDDFMKSPLFSQNERLVARGLENHPDIILQIPNVSLDNVRIAIRNGFLPKKDHFYSHPHLRKFNLLLEKAFESDPSMISIFDREHLTITKALDANSRGYIADEKDLITNRDLTLFRCIMESAIKKNPKMILYLSPVCSIDSFIMDEALQKYEITKEDLKNFPDLTKNYSIMCHLPQFRLYSAYLTDEEKEKELEKALRNDQNLTIDVLPFLDYRFGAKADIRKLNRLLECLKIKIHESDMDEQQYYFELLDEIIDGIVKMHYTENKSSFLYADIVSLHDDLVVAFEKTTITQNLEYLYSFVINLYDFVGKKISKECLVQNIEKLYRIYKEEKEFDLSVTSNFCNYVLNEHRNYFCSKEKTIILKDVEEKMTLAHKKKNSILNGRKIQKITEFIRDRQWSQLGITEEEFHAIMKYTEKDILNNKDIRKSNMNIKMEDLDIVAIYFEGYGTLNIDIVKFVLNGSDIEAIKFIIRKFEQIKFKLISNVTLSEEQKRISLCERRKLGGLNHTNYIIAEEDRYVKNLSSLLLKLNDKVLDKILENKKFIPEVVSLLPLLGLIEEFNIDTFLNILSNYDRVLYKISKGIASPPNVDHTSFILNKIDDVILLANAYSSIDNITLFALGKNIVSSIDEQNSTRYLEFYLKMLDRQTGNMPPICIQTLDYYVESGLYSDPERLLIGKKPFKSSCIDLLNPGGISTYIELLRSISGDVALVRDHNKNLLSRVFLFRRGNIVQMVTYHNDKIPIELYKKIADEMMKKASANQDNINYIFINAGNENLKKEGYITLYDSRFRTCFPHADTCCYGILLSSSENVQKEIDIKLDFDAVVKGSYIKPRKKVSYDPMESEITRLRALYVVMEEDTIAKENKAQDFEPFYKEEYKNVFCGEDWYIAVKMDGTLEELVLPTKDPRTYEEVEQVRGKINSHMNKTL